VTSYELRWKRSACRDLRGIGRAEAERILEAIESRLLRDPRRSEPLAVSGKPLWKFRVGDYRILYTFDDAQVWVLIVRVAHRSSAYRGL
jgi:mRNA interferase RelE/StbE